MNALAVSLALVACGAPARADDLQTLRIVMYAGEAADCANSGRFRSGYEINPLVKPFSHGGIPTYCAAPVVGNLVLGALTRRWPKWLKIAGTGLQITSNAWGVYFTEAHSR